MGKDTVHMATPVKNMKRSSASSIDRLHFTGGLQGHREPGGWVVGPIRRDGKTGLIEGVPEEKVGGLANEIGVRLIGAEQITTIDPNLPDRFWTPLIGAPPLKYPADQSWGMIASGAHGAADPEYSKLARSISSCLRAAGLQLRNASNEYNAQLCAALVRGAKPNLWFSNTALSDIHLSFHSLLAEMGSTRDYLAAVAARRVGAPGRIEAFNRLEDWATKTANASPASDVLVARLLEEGQASSPEPWLSDIGEYRNLFLHRQSLGADERSNRLVLRQSDSRFGPIIQVAMEIGSIRGDGGTCDALAYFSYLYARLCRLADFAAHHAKYPALIPQFKAT